MPRKSKAAEAAPAASGWCLYLIECRNGHYYAGITNDLQRRYDAHVAGRGAKYTRANPPKRLIGSRTYPDRSAASKAEFAIRKLSRHEKVRFVHADRVEST